MIDPALWSRVQTMCERRRTRAPGRIVKRGYSLRLCCAGCGLYLYGDTGRYRLPSPTCQVFLAATPDARRRYREPGDKRVNGHSYPQAWYEDAIGELLAGVGSLDDLTITDAVRLYGDEPARADDMALARIEREREDAPQRLAKTRDIAAWQTMMARLDTEAEVARQPQQGRGLSPSEVVSYLRSLPALWTDSGPDGRRALATALFAKTEVLGYERMFYELTPDAIELGLNAALPAEFEFT